MADTRQNWIRWFLLGALCLSVRQPDFAQSNLAQSNLAQSNPADSPRQHFVQIQSPQSGALAGRLTDLHSSPLAGVSIILRNKSTGVEVRATTARNGVFRFASLDAGEYMLDADAAQLGHGQLEGIFVTGGVESRVQAALNFQPVAPALLEAAAHQPTVAPTIATAAPNASPVSVVPAAPVAPSVTTATPVAPPAPFHPALGTSTPQVIASIDRELLRSLPLAALSAPDAAKISAPPATSSLVPPPISPPVATRSEPPTAGAVAASPSAAPMPSALHQAPLQPLAFRLPARAALETQSAPIELALGSAPPNAFPLKPGTAPPLAATAVPPSLVQAAMLPSPPAASAVAAAQPSDPVTPAVSTTISASQLQSLPASGRRWQDFLLDTPAAGASAGSSQASFRGSQQSAQVSVDGANISLAFGVSAGSGARVSNSSGIDSGPQGSTGGQAWAGGRGLGVSEAAVREVTAAAGNVEAAGMRSAGGRTAIRTESGSNALHGQGSFFDRQNSWGAQNPYTQWVQNTGSITAPNFTAVPFTPPDHETVWGLGLGGDIRRNKLFWFAALDQQPAQRSRPVHGQKSH